MSIASTTDTATLAIPSAIVRAAAAIIDKPSARFRETGNDGQLAASRVRIRRIPGVGEFVESATRNPFATIEKPSAYFSAGRYDGKWGEPIIAHVDEFGGRQAIKAGFDSIEIGEGFVRLGSTKLTDTNREQIPSFPEVSADDAIGGGWVTTLDEFADMVSDVGSAADTETSRYALGGILFESGENGLHCIASDGRRLHCRTFSAYWQTEPVKALLPMLALKNCVKSLRATGARKATRLAINFYPDGAMLSWESDGWDCRLFVRNLEGRFPKWRDVVNDASEPHTFTIPHSEASEIFRGLARGICKVRETGEPRSVRLSAAHFRDNSCLRIFASNRYGEHDSIHENSTVSSEFGEFLFDPEFLADGIPKASFERIPVVGVVDGKNNGAMTISGNGGLYPTDGSAPGWVAIVMPMERN
jgi:hypothetical protein